MSLWRLGKGPGTHALVVGVGEYPSLQGGRGPLFADHEGMGQLTSAPVSALRFAEWLANSYRSGTHPLRSLRLLISAPGQPAWAPRTDLAPMVPDRATSANLKAALLDWHAELTQTDRALFFFSGHGIAAGIQQTLLLEDYGLVPAAALGAAFDFTMFREAMLRAPALEQIYFVDACRVSSGKLMRARGRYGDPVLDPSAALPSPPRRQPVLYATMPGAVAYGRPGLTSLFTEALLKAMRGAGAEQTVSGWAIRPGRLRDGLEHLLDSMARPFGSVQSCLGDGIASFDLHELDAPEVPVVVHCRAPINVAEARVFVTGQAASHQTLPPVPQPCAFDLPVGEYSFVAAPPNGVPKKRYVAPPFTEVALP